ncbi:uncharacterized protein LOC108710597 isoform X2 [Xenopus laevis]|nr:uncharacterized protein LOC108710597 isoform X2 [Xenopus laevis]
MLINGTAQWNYGSTSCITLPPPPPASSNSPLLKPTAFSPSDSSASTSTDHFGTSEEFDFTVPSTTEQTQERAEPKEVTAPGSTSTTGYKYSDPTTENDVLSVSFGMSTENDVHRRPQDISQPIEISPSGNSITHGTLEQSTPNGQSTGTSEPEALTFPRSTGTFAEIDAKKGMLTTTEPEQLVSNPTEFTTEQIPNNLGIEQKPSPGYISIGVSIVASIIAISLILFLKYRHRAVYKPDLTQSAHNLPFDGFSNEDHEIELECLNNRDSITLFPSADDNTEEVTYL